MSEFISLAPGEKIQRFAPWSPEPRTDHNWIQTFSGRQFWPLNPEPWEVYIEDIAHGLSLACRYTGQCNEFYSVAEHSVRVSYQVQRLCLETDKAPGRFERARTVILAALLHDASEAYVADVSRPVKHSPYFGPIYRAIEANLMRQINRRFRVPHEPPVVKMADDQLLATEKRDLLKKPPRPWTLRAQPLLEKITPWTSLQAEAIFLHRFLALETARELAEYDF